MLSLLRIRRAAGACALLLALALALPAQAAAAQAAPHCAPGEVPQFRFGFAHLKDLLGGAMGDPVECSHVEPGTGHVLQKTTTGLAYYLPQPNIPVFTTGFRHWALTERGLVVWVGDSVTPPASARLATDAAADPPDVVLDVPRLSVRELVLEVDNLDARVALRARLGQLLNLRAGVTASVDQVRLVLRGVNAEVHLKVRLDDVADIVDAAMTLLDRNPQLLEEALSTLAQP